MTVHKEPTAHQMALRTAIILLIFVVVFTALLASAYKWTRPAIEASAVEEKMKMIREVLPPEYFDNALLEHKITIPPTPELGLNQATLAYRALKQGMPTALVFESMAPDGYAGAIRLLLAVASDNTLIGVRVTQHKETPGLGDYIEPRKDRNKSRPWIRQFDGQSLAKRPQAQWRVKKDGGSFDFVTGATVTPRAIIKATAKSMLWFENVGKLILHNEANTSPPPENSNIKKTNTGKTYKNGHHDKNY